MVLGASRRRRMPTRQLFIDSHRPAFYYVTLRYTSNICFLGQLRDVFEIAFKDVHRLLLMAPPLIKTISCRNSSPELRHTKDFSADESGFVDIKSIIQNYSRPTASAPLLHTILPKPRAHAQL